MKANEGTADRIIRVAIGIIMGVLLATKAVTGALAVVAGIVGVLMLVTGTVGWCALYAALGLKTRAAK